MPARTQQGGQLAHHFDVVVQAPPGSLATWTEPSVSWATAFGAFVFRGLRKAGT